MQDNNEAVRHALAGGVDVVYFVYNTEDAAVIRRTLMFEAAGVSVLVIGFRRRVEEVQRIGRSQVIDLGRTFDAKLMVRLLSVARAMPLAIRLAWQLRGPTVVIGRNLESMAMAAAVKIAAPSKVKSLVYEVLDIHSALTTPGMKSRVLRAVERRLYAMCSHLVVSSPAYIREHFAALTRKGQKVLLVENKVFQLGEWPAPRPHGRQNDAPIAIGWHGILRCRKSLALLADLTKAMPGRFHIHVSGRVARTAIPDFDALIEGNPDITYHGPYQAPRGLADVYRRIDFMWSIDYFEEGKNSLWLLPNRLYEACLYGVVPIALSGTQTAAWLTSRRGGAIMDSDAVDVMAKEIVLAADNYDELQAHVAALPREEVVATMDECRRITAKLGIEASEPETGSAFQRL